MTKGTNFTNTNFRSTLSSTRYLVAATIYVVVVLALLATTWIALSTIGERRATVRAAENMLAQLEGRSALAGRDNGSPLGAAPAGSPFLEGKTVNVAGAALLQRIAAAINKIGGNVLSSQVELQKADSKDGWVGLVVSCEIEPGTLQQLLYDLEAGMPFLFIDQLAVQAPVVGVEEIRMRVLLGVSGQWAGGK
jgi:general secretion pathway protein M